MRLIIPVVALASAAFSQSSVPAQQRVELQNVSVIVADHRLILAAGGDEYVLASLEVPEWCPAAGGGTWACGEGAREVLAAAIKGEVLECTIKEPDEPLPVAGAVECFAQTRNLNLWMLSIGRARLTPGARETNPLYDDAERVARATGAMNWYRPARADVEPSLGRHDRSWSTVAPDTTTSSHPGPARYPLGSRATRRGATADERLALGEDLQQDELRAGVWDYGLFQVVVAESASGCVALTWCRFVVLEDGRPVFIGVARETPELAAADGAELVWEAPGGAWKFWAPSQ